MNKVAIRAKLRREDLMKSLDSRTLKSFRHPLVRSVDATGQ